MMVILFPFLAMFIHVNGLVLTMDIYTDLEESIILAGP